MDKKAVLGIVLIFIVLLLWQPYMKWVSPPPQKPAATQEQKEPALKDEPQKPAEVQPSAPQTVPEIKTSGQIGSIKKSNLTKKLIVIETPKYRGILSTKGATVEQWYLNEYRNARDSVVNIIRTNAIGNLAVSFKSTEGFDIDLSSFDFIPESVLPSPDSLYTIQLSQESYTLRLTADLGDNRKVRKEFTFHPEKLEIDLLITFENCQSLIARNSYTLTWGTGIQSSEIDLADDMRFSKAMALYGTDIEKFDVQNALAKTAKPLVGDINWVAAKSKYFCALIIPKEKLGAGLTLSGTNTLIEKTFGTKNYVASMTMPFSPSAQIVSQSFLVYFGTIDYHHLKTFDNTIGRNLHFKEMLDINAYIRDLSMGVYWIFTFLHTFIPNYGLVIIIFAIIINLLLYPLTARSYKSMKRMTQIQPLMAEINEKYKGDPKKKQEALVRLYKEHKINPLGGCLPMLFQMPVFFAIYPIFRAIELRGAHFVWWITDLSRPDTVATIPNILPLNNLFYGNNVNILTIIYAISLFIQQKIMIKDPKQKAMVYVMPILLLLMLNKLSSGFILYFIIFNLLSISQRYLVRDKEEPKPEKSRAPISVKSLADKFSKKKKK